MNTTYVVFSIINDFPFFEKTKKSMPYFIFVLLIIPAFLILKSCKKYTAEETEQPIRNLQRC